MGIYLFKRTVLEDLLRDKNTGGSGRQDEHFGYDVIPHALRSGAKVLSLSPLVDAALPAGLPPHNMLQTIGVTPQRASCMPLQLLTLDSACFGFSSCELVALPLPCKEIQLDGWQANDVLVCLPCTWAHRQIGIFGLPRWWRTTTRATGWT